MEKFGQNGNFCENVSEITSIDPSILYTRLIRRSGRRGLEPIPAIIGREAGYTLNRLPVHHRATQRQMRQTTCFRIITKKTFLHINKKFFLDDPANLL